MVRRDRGQDAPELKPAMDLGKEEAPKAAEIQPEEKPTEVEPKAPKVAMTPPPAAPPQSPPVHEPPPTRVRYAVWARLSGIKWDKLAGFRYLVKKAKLGPLTVPEWWAEWAKYQKRPVG